jgi:hypothetical protein
MEQAKLTDFLEELLVAHGLNPGRHEDWLFPDNKLPGIRAAWFPGEYPGRAGLLEVRVALDDKRVIDKLFAGMGSDEAGFRDAMNGFATGSFHVMLAALWLPGHAHGVTAEDWSVGDRTWRAHIGSVVTRRGKEEEVSFTDAAFDAAEAAVRAEPLEPGLHWYRLFYCNTGTGETVVEALLDNEPWPAGAEAFGNADWEKRDSFYSIRNFSILDV